jgi:hypothetical protein
MGRRRLPGFGAVESHHILKAEKAISELHRRLAQVTGTGTCDPTALYAAGALSGKAQTHIDSVRDMITKRALGKEFEAADQALLAALHRNCQGGR